ncbi:hypothetical protein HanHA300_Chr16g0621971 [Helianthus annuus]|nr:hypothetical protein HanHA300_Chr16g0621971 [Helianthus annuus]KAJ0461489.1 hypothetical protein HanHA89_Chr16g0672841 [Helianthus annuus]KAJ0641911.1 hypothetical protein HanLR1_Chr16g0632461 [Helianthus annuus]KAJ0645787.1 hypothetical protein HanOQP8_Chr16g0627821 [Helianthus annuus]
MLWSIYGTVRFEAKRVKHDQLDPKEQSSWTDFGQIVKQLQESFNEEQGATLWKR